MRTPAGSGPVVVGLPGPPQRAPGRADWMCGVVGVRPGRTSLARPRRPGDGRRADRRPPARCRAAPRGARRAGRHLGGLPDPAGAGTGHLTVIAGRGGSRPGAAAVGHRAGAALPARGPGRAGTRCRPDAHHAERAAPARPALAHSGRRARRRVQPDRGQPALRRADGRRPRRGAGSSATGSGATSSAPATAPSTRPRSRPASNPCSSPTCA